MSSAGRQNLSVIGQDEAYFTVGNSMVYPHSTGVNFSKARPFIDERQYAATQSINHTRGSFTQFAVSRLSDLSGEWHLQVDRAAGTATYDASKGSPYCLDWELYSLIDRVEITYASKPLYTITGKQMKRNMRQGLYHPSKKVISGYAQLQNGFLSIPERQARYFTAQTAMKAPLQVPWRFSKKRLPLIAVPADIIVKVFWNASTATYHLPGGTSSVTAYNPGDLSNALLSIESTHLLETDRQSLYADVYDSRRRPYQIKGVVWEYEKDISITTNTGSTNADATWTQTLQSMRNATSVIDIELTYQDSQNSQACLSDMVIPLRTFYLQDLNKAVTHVYSGIGEGQYSNAQSLETHVDNALAYPGAPGGAPIHSLKFCPAALVPQTEHDCFTPRQLWKYQTPQVKFTYNSNIHSLVPWLDVAGLEGSTITKTSLYFNAIGRIDQLWMLSQSDFRPFLNN